MRLLHFKVGAKDDSININITEHFRDTPKYAILSHRWRDDEVSYQDMVADGSIARKKKGYAKIERCCREAAKLGLSYAWVDTCCIDKTSSTELSEAINSMYRWYSESQICIAYLDDIMIQSWVESEQPIRAWLSDAGRRGRAIKHSCWFSRGWTLQELIAPGTMVMYAEDWATLGTRKSLALQISEITGIDSEILIGDRKPSSASVAERMSWASQRETTRAEDLAYSLMGIFGVNMPTLYGEGDRAFRRLQLEIMRISNDHSLFAWQSNETSGDMLATSPAQFRESGKFYPLRYANFVRKFSIDIPKPDYTMTNAGLHIQLPIAPIPKHENLWVAFLACTVGQDASAVMFFEQTQDSIAMEFHRITLNGRTIDRIPNIPAPLLETCSLRTIWVSEKFLSKPSRDGLEMGSEFFRCEPGSHIDWSARVYTPIIVSEFDGIYHNSGWKGPDSRYVTHQVAGQNKHFTLRLSLEGSPVITVAFGESNGRMWYYTGTFDFAEDRAHQDCRFMTGLVWYKHTDDIHYYTEPKHHEFEDLGIAISDEFDETTNIHTFRLEIWPRHQGRLPSWLEGVDKSPQEQQLPEADAGPHVHFVKPCVRIVEPPQSEDSPESKSWSVYGDSNVRPKTRISPGLVNRRKNKKLSFFQNLARHTRIEKHQFSD